MALLIKNGEIVTSSSRFTGDVLCEGEKIVALGANLQAPEGTETLDATGHYLFPGFIDPHTHIYLPFMGTYAKDTYGTASEAALCGGTTTFFDFCIPGQAELPFDGLAAWDAQSLGKSRCDFSYHLAVTRFDAEVEKQLREAVATRGIQSFKIFLAYKGALELDDSSLYRLLQLAKELDVVVAAHCENAAVISIRQTQLLAAGNTGPEFHHESRPPEVEAEGVSRLMRLAELTGAAVYIVHLSCAEALEEAVAARLRGVNVRVETLIQYLLLDKTAAERPNFEGAKYVMSPPLRDISNQGVLWDALRTGVIDTVATDHAPFDFATQKIMGRDDFTRIPNGIPALGERVDLLFTHGVKTGRISLERFVELASTNAAKIFGLYPRKGTIQPAADADLVIYDPNYEGVLGVATQKSAVDYNAFEGMPIGGHSRHVVQRGRIVVRDGHCVAQPGNGQFLKR